METSNNTNSGGLGFSGLLTLIFITLKLLGKIDWPWVWVLSPIWIAMGISIIAIAIVGLIYVWTRK